ncbi:glycoside hydrolase family 16 protein [Suillus clintonianus]|uniref:glycoside hydrolase family 16 protein n=1 Tax=Suillus clintonianus TaxID=1904413 RepID=UPI001B87D769|nr:glycoside hydrolase family 16 protein [Suillus clintonianus]KAG2148914.1 glycoside hydrolase family 16 protein [Suillus clintonianus]
MSASADKDGIKPPSPFYLGDNSRRTKDKSHQHHNSTASVSNHSRPSTAGTAASSIVNPFSPPASVVSFSIDPISSTGSMPLAPPGQHELSEPIPRHGVSLLPRSTSYYGSRPNTGDSPSRVTSGIRLRETFAAPPARPLTAVSTSPSLAPPSKTSRMRSTMLEDPSTLDKPWVTTKDPYARIAYLLTYSVMFLGIAASAVRCYFGYKSVPLINGNLCMVLDEDFSSDTDTTFGANGNWFREVQLGGFGNGEFEMTTSSTNNSYTSNGYLYITPTLTADQIGSANILNGYTYNLTDCTYNATNPTTSNASFNAAAYYQSCGAVSNSSTGAVINPVQSARITTRKSASIRYGKVEVRAKVPRGDWLWPAIWMLPVNDTYGPWPMSGEIDIMEARGNGRTYPDQGIDYVRGSLNWGPLSFLNAVSKTFGWWTQRRTDYGEDFHTYTLEWTESFLRIYVDTRLHYMLELSFNEPFFTRGDFPSVVENGTQPIVLQNPWVNGTNATPFDQPFYLILNLAVGGTNGWFPDNAGSKPWLDNSKTAMLQFTEAQDTWYPTWGSDGESSSFIVDYVKMWEIC